jgi:hypothetical protein
MREVFFNYIPKTLYEPCVEDLSVFNKNTTQKFLDTIKGLDKLAKSVGVKGGLGDFSLRLKEIEMPVSGCVNRSLALMQQLEADRSLLEKYKTHLQSMKLLSDSLNSVCHNPTYFVPQECQK